MKALLWLSSIVLLSACASGPKLPRNVDLNVEGRLPVVSQSTNDSYLLASGERRDPQSLSIPKPPEFIPGTNEQAFRLGMGFDGNGVPVLGVPMLTSEAMERLAAALTGAGDDVVTQDLTAARLVVASERFRPQERPWLWRWAWWQEKRLIISFSEMGTNTRISIWRYNESQPEEPLRSELFQQIADILS